jgi:hypothetical protein
MGPADKGTTLYPPHPSSGMRVRFLNKHHNVFMLLLDDSLITHTLILDLQYLIYYIPSINYLHAHWFFDFWYFQIFSLDYILWYGGMSTEYGTFVGTSFDIRTARVHCQGELSPPPPVTRPPPGKPYFLEYCVNTCALVGVT